MLLKPDVFYFLDEYKTDLINSDTLGYAFEPEQRFENPDGSDIVFDTDFFDDKREAATIPGPFTFPYDDGIIYIIE
jgi:hypothetical protein